jgi:4-amino-4-deoxy-L-arabinose transferase-like glycosyltransferase
MSTSPPDARRATRRWWLIVVLLAGAAIAARASYVLVVSRHEPLGADATWYFLQAGSLHDGLGYIDPSARFASGAEVATANFPPLYPALLWLVQRVGGDSLTLAFLAGAPMGGLTVVLTALLARRVAGPTVALVAAGIVAVDPMLIAADGSLMSEVLYVPLVVLATLLALTAGETGRWWRWVALGAVCGLAALTRQEALLLLVVLVAPVLWWSKLPLRPRLLGIGGAIVIAALVVTPWVVRNQRTVGEAAISTSSPATSLAGANCDATYSGASLGSWEFACTGTESRSRLSEAAWDAQLRSGALTYAREHARRLPLVLPARELRVWGVWSPSDLVARDAVETRSAGFQWLVWAAGTVTLVGGIVGLFGLRHHGRQVVVLAGPIAMVAITALVSYGNPRFRSVAEPMLAIGLAALAVRVAHRRAGTGTSTGDEIDDESDLESGDDSDVESGGAIDVRASSTDRDERATPARSSTA